MNQVIRAAKFGPNIFTFTGTGDQKKEKEKGQGVSSLLVPTEIFLYFFCQISVCKNISPTIREIPVGDLISMIRDSFP